jgi:hypothetical protein
MSDGGPAFPAEKVEHGEYMLPASQGGATVIKLQGMTLRDYFAAKAMQAWLSDPELTWGSELPSLCAADSYRVADAMLKARK